MQGRWFDIFIFSPSSHVQRPLRLIHKITIKTTFYTTNQSKRLQIDRINFPLHRLLDQWDQGRVHHIRPAHTKCNECGAFHLGETFAWHTLQNVFIADHSTRPTEDSKFIISSIDSDDRPIMTPWTESVTLREIIFMTTRRSPQQVDLQSRARGRTKYDDWKIDERGKGVRRIIGIVLFCVFFFFIIILGYYCRKVFRIGDERQFGVALSPNEERF